MHVVKGEQSEIDYRKETKYGIRYLQTVLHIVAQDSEVDDLPRHVKVFVCYKGGDKLYLFTGLFLAVWTAFFILFHISRVYYRMRFHT